MVLSNNRQLRQEEIQEKFNIPPVLAEFYFRTGPFFSLLRSYRDKIVHSGKVSEIIFELDRGFAVQRTTEPFRSFNVWNDDDIFNNLASLRPVIYHVIAETLQSCDDFVKAIIACIAFPPSLMPNHNVYTRGFHTGAYIELARTIRHQRWWA